MSTHTCRGDWDHNCYCSIGRDHTEAEHEVLWGRDVAQQAGEDRRGGGIRQPERPVRPGQLVTRNGVTGITTDYPMKNSPRIGVMFVGANYPVLVSLDRLIVVVTL